MLSENTTNRVSEIIHPWLVAAPAGESSAFRLFITVTPLFTDTDDGLKSKRLPW